MTSAEFLTAIIALLNSGTAWCKGANARDADGLPCAPRSPNAVSWDLTGALIKLSEGQSNYTSFNETLSILTTRVPATFKSRDIEAWNDTATWTSVLALLQGNPQ